MYTAGPIEQWRQQPHSPSAAMDGNVRTGATPALNWTRFIYIYRHIYRHCISGNQRTLLCIVLSVYSFQIVLLCLYLGTIKCCLMRIIDVNSCQVQYCTVVICIFKYSFKFTVVFAWNYNAVLFRYISETCPLGCLWIIINPNIFLIPFSIFRYYN